MPEESLVTLIEKAGDKSHSMIEMVTKADLL